MVIINRYVRLLKLTFSDKDVVHLLPGETLIVPEGFVVVKQETI